LFFKELACEAGGLSYQKIRMRSIFTCLPGRC
jgi:hypothetical protein